MRTPYIIANWKMNMERSRLDRFFEHFTPSPFLQKNTRLVLCPSFPDVEFVINRAERVGAAAGAQNIFYEARGAYTGEVSAEQLQALGCSYVIIGHSERREHFQETDEQVNAKAQLALQYNLQPIICLGESLAEKEAGETKKVISRQLRACLRNLFRHDMKKVIIAYEPRWAISTSQDNMGEGDSPESAQVIHKYIRHTIAELFDDEISESMAIIYGGSVNPNTAPGYGRMDDVDGALIGSASREAETFTKIAEAFI